MGNINHDVVWTKEKIARFWTFYSTSVALEDSYFSKKVGGSIIALARKYIPLTGNILDYGCGPGFLIEKLLEANLNCWGFDAVESNIRKLETKFQGQSHFKGAYYADKLPTQIQGEYFDVVFFVETIEHLLPDEIPVTLREIYRITKTGGKVVVTTQNNENLGVNMIICPDCGCLFHRMQHLSVWNTDTLAKVMADAGFRKIACKSTTFRPRSLLGFFMRIADVITRHRNENLIYVGEKHQ